MKRMMLATLAAAAVAAAVAGPAAAGTSPTTLKLKKTSVGTILVNGRGFTLYAFTKDGRNRDTCAGIGGCLSIWPVVERRARPTLGPGVKRVAGRDDHAGGGKKQLTYGGHPLYTYAADSGPGQTFYVNFLQFGGRWPAVNAAGQRGEVGPTAGRRAAPGAGAAAADAPGAPHRRRPVLAPARRPRAAARPSIRSRAARRSRRSADRSTRTPAADSASA